MYYLRENNLVYDEQNRLVGKKMTIRDINNRHLIKMEGYTYIGFKHGGYKIVKDENVKLEIKK